MTLKYAYRRARQRWRSKMPVFFRWLSMVAAGISAVALAINTALLEGGAEIPVWWSAIYPYLIGIGAGIVATSKFTMVHKNYRHNELDNGES